MVCSPVQEIINSLKLVDYLLIQADKPWYRLRQDIMNDCVGLSFTLVSLAGYVGWPEPCHKAVLHFATH